MELWLVMLLMAGAVILIFGICALCLWVEKRLPAGKFDERQMADRGKGYRLACFVGLFYYFGAMMYIVIADAPSVVSCSLIMAGIAVMLMAMEFYCVLTHAAVGRRMSPVKAMIGYFLLGGVHLGIALYRLLLESWRYVDTRWLYAYMFIAVSFLGIGVIHLVQYLRHKE